MAVVKLNPINFVSNNMGWTFVFVVTYLLFWIQIFPIWRTYGYSSDNYDSKGGIPSGELGSGGPIIVLALLILITIIYGMQIYKYVTTGKIDGGGVMDNEDISFSTKSDPIVSIIIPAHNASKWIDDCLTSIKNVYYRPLEVSVYDDASMDDTLEKLLSWIKPFEESSIKLIITKSDTNGLPYGAGYSRNRAVEASCGDYLCFIDADDLMMPQRVTKQLQLAKTNRNLLIGSNFRRDPIDATWHYTQWANRLQTKELFLQQYRECTLIMPTWFMHRLVFDKVGGFNEERNEDKSPVPEDLIFFLTHLSLGGELDKIEEELIIYRHSNGSVSSRISRRTLLRTRISFFEANVLKNWTSYTIWGCGRDGRQFYNLLSIDQKLKIKEFCDIDPKKIGSTYYCISTKRRIPIIHFSNAIPPIVCCVAMGRTNGELEANVKSLNLIEGINFWHFT